jgi:Xaa-Pro aminopeptidase
VFFAYAVVTQSHAILFVNPEQVDDVVREHLGQDVDVETYEGIWEYLRGIGEREGLGKGTVSADASSASNYRLMAVQQVLLGDKASLAVAEAIGQVPPLSFPLLVPNLTPLR